ncbi:MAG: hypothetical protein ABIP85_22090 [Chthoniobacteraceae bacterium]
MLRTLIGFATLSLLGCHKPANSGAEPFPNLQLGISSVEATRLAGREGKPYDHGKLPVSLKPRQNYKGIPEATAYFVWWNDKTGIPELTLGIHEARVIYKEVQWDENGQRKVSRWTLPQYQH